MGCMTRLFVLALALVLVVPAGAQMAMPSSGATAFKDTSVFKPPSGAKVAIIEFEDLECLRRCFVPLAAYHQMRVVGLSSVPQTPAQVPC